MGRPGCPELALFTASIAKKRTVLIHSNAVFGSAFSTTAVSCARIVNLERRRWIVDGKRARLKTPPLLAEIASELRSDDSEAGENEIVNDIALLERKTTSPLLSRVELHKQTWIKGKLFIPQLPFTSHLHPLPMAKIAILGAGVFSRDAYLPLLKCRRQSL